jgi:hypothetical protein
MAKKKADADALARALDELADRFAGGAASSLPRAAVWRRLGESDRATGPATDLLRAALRFQGEPKVLARLVALVEPGWASRFFELAHGLAAPPPPARAFQLGGQRGRTAAGEVARSFARRARFASAQRTLAILLETGGDAGRSVALLAALLDGDAPSAPWASRLERAIAAFGPARYQALAAALLEEPSVDEPGGDEGSLPRVLDARIVWSAVLLAKTPETLRSLGDTAAREARSARPARALAIVSALGAIAPERAVPELERLRHRVKHASLRRAIDGALDALAATRGISRATLEEQTIPSFELDLEGARTLADGTAIVLEPSGHVSLAPPVRARKGEASLLGRSIEETLSIQRGRLEQAMVDERRFDRAAFASLVAHPILRNLASRVLWVVQGKLAFFRGRLEDLAGKPLELEEPLSIAHPALLPADDLERARARLVALAIVQPWKQLFRETYAPTRGEHLALACERFKNEVVPHPKLYALARTRGWTGFGCLGEGSFEGKRAFAQGFRARLTVDLATGAGWGEPDRAIRLDSVFFEVKEGRDFTRHSLGSVPPVVFSEACRDLDLVVGVASVGEDTAWIAWEEARRQGEEPLFRARLERYDSALAATAETRRALLGRILPSLGLGSRVRVEGKFAHVQGELHAYRVHLGSANVHVEPSGRFVAFGRPAHADAAPGVYLPEDASLDPRTAEVVRRILLLAGDALVSDPELAAQLGEG